MKGILFAILSIILLANCDNAGNNTVNKTDSTKAIPIQVDTLKKDKSLRADCSFTNPDTSVSGISLRNVQSTLAVLGERTKLHGDTTYAFYSSDQWQVLSLTIHPGDYYNQVSVFHIYYSEDREWFRLKIKTKEFRTEKGIKLGIGKREIIKKLGACYIAKDSSQNNVELYYRLELPDDSKTGLLQHHNMPVYYASYKLDNDKLVDIEFGFEYP